MPSSLEYFDLITPQGDIIGRASRAQCHRDPNLLHAVVHCLVRNSHGDLLLQLRHRNKDIQPGKWDTSVGGHLNSGETVANALRRELAEEIGLDCQQAPTTPLYTYIMRSAIETELVHSFTCCSDGPFQAQASEIELLRFWSIAEINANLCTGIFTPNFEDEFHRFLTATSIA